jgi:Phosphotransferase enzyme family
VTYADFHPAPTTIESVLDPVWLTAALGVDDGHRVVDVAEVERSKTVANKVRFRVVVEAPDGSRRSHAYCVKGHFDSDSGDSLRGETRFYRHLAPTLGVQTPQAYYTGIDPETGRSIVIMDDVVGNGGHFLSAHSPYSPATVCGTLEQLARLHGATWGAKDVMELDWLEPRIRAMAGMYPADVLQNLLDDGRAEGLPGAYRNGETLREAVFLIGAVEPTCVIHGDAHSGNAYLDETGRTCWLDWQVIQAGHWATDVSYHIATALDVEDRRAEEEHLLRHYLDELGRFVAEPPSWDEAWERYTLHFPYGYFLWTITRISSRAVVLIHIPRLATAMDDHGTLGRLGVL